MPHALIVDDIIENQIILGEILQDLDVTFDSAICISEAVALASSKPFDVVLMDLAIPRNRFEDVIVFGGLEAAREIHEKLGCTDLAIIAVTANGMKDIEAQVFEAGIREFVEKSAKFSQRIEAALRRVIDMKPVLADDNIRPENSPPLPVIASRDEPLVTPPRAHSARQSESILVEKKSPAAVTAEAAGLKANGLTSAHELRARVAKQTATDLSRLDQLLEEAVETERDEQIQQAILKLRAEFEKACKRLQDQLDGPAPGETYGHWIVNVLLGIEYQTSRLIDAETHEHFARLSPVLKEIKRGVHQTIALAKTKIGQIRVPKPPSSEKLPARSTPQITASVPASMNPSRQAIEKLKSVSDDQLRRLVMIVDDQHEARSDLEGKLKRLNYRVVSCESALTAMELLELLHFDVCLLDLDMPEMNGLEMIEKIRGSLASSKSSIIVVSGSAEKFAAADAIAMGADDYLEKPADERLLHARIQSCLRQTDARLTELGKFLPRHIVERVINNKDLLDKPAPADVTVIVCDIRGFSRISERIGPVQTIEWISDVMNDLSQIILERGGTIVDYVGDEIMAMWGAPIASPQHAADACMCALEIQKAAERLGNKWSVTINAPLRIGIGINSGLAVVGNTGSKHRIKYGPLGDTVNVASRVQGATKYLHSCILMTQSTAMRIDQCSRGRRICSVRVQNISEPVQLFELAACNTDQSNARHKKYEAALAAFESEDMSTALTLLAELLIQDPEDGPTKLLVMRVIQSQLGGAFDPIWTLPGK